MLVVAICGGSGSGKTTLARYLQRSLGTANVQLISCDHYYRPLRAGQLPSERDWDEPAALDLAQLARHLLSLKAGQSIERPQWDFSSHSRGAARVVVEPKPVILVEGILIMAPEELRAAYDLSVFVDAPSDVRLARRIRRDLVERGRDPDGVLTQYLEQVRPAHLRWVEPWRWEADLVVPNSGPRQEERFRMVSQVIQERLAVPEPPKRG